MIILMLDQIVLNQINFKIKYYFIISNILPVFYLLLNESNDLRVKDIVLLLLLFWFCIGVGIGLLILE